MAMSLALVKRTLDLLFCGWRLTWVIVVSMEVRKLSTVARRVVSSGRIAAEVASVLPSWARRSVVQSAIEITVSGGFMPVSYMSHFACSLFMSSWRPSREVSGLAMVLFSAFMSVIVKWGEDSP